MIFDGPLGNCSDIEVYSQVEFLNGGELLVDAVVFKGVKDADGITVAKEVNSIDLKRKT